MQKIKQNKNEQKNSAVRPTAPSRENHTSQLLREVKEMPLLGYAAKSLHNSTHTRAGRDAKLQVTVVECPERNLLPALLRFSTRSRKPEVQQGELTVARKIHLDTSNRSFCGAARAI